MCRSASTFIFGYDGSSISSFLGLGISELVEGFGWIGVSCGVCGAEGSVGLNNCIIVFLLVNIIPVRAMIIIIIMIMQTILML